MLSNDSSWMRVVLRLFGILLFVGGAGCSEDARGPADAPALDAEDAAPDHPGDETEKGADAFTGGDGLDEVGLVPSDGSDADQAEVGRIPLCLRLRDPDRPVKVLELSHDVRGGYLTFVAADCSISGLLAVPSGTVAAWSNRIYDWNLDLWGCTDRAVSGFALVRADVTDLTAADAAWLIEGYLKAATRVLRLSPREVAEMRGDLVRLGMTAITRLSDERLFSECDAHDAGKDDVVSSDEPSDEGGDGSDSAGGDASATAGGQR